MSDVSEVSDQTDWRTVIAATVAMSIVSFVIGMAYPLVSLSLAEMGYSSAEIGTVTAMGPIGIIIASTLLPIMVRRFGAKPVAIVAVAGTIFALAGYYLFRDVFAWIVLRLIQGIFIAVILVISEAWITGSSGLKHKGKVVGIYSAVSAACLALGSVVIGYVGIENGWAIGVCVAALGLALIPVFMARQAPVKAKSKDKHSFVRFMKKAPDLLAAVGAFALFDAAMLALLSVYSLNVGLDVKTSAYILAPLVAGNIILQYPIGWMADRFGHRITILICSGLCLVLCAALPFFMLTIWKWPILFVVGSTAYGHYTLALGELGRRFSGDELVQGASAFAKVWGIAAFGGVFVGGWVMEWFGPHGLPIMLAVGFLVYIVADLVYSPSRLAAKTA